MKKLRWGILGTGMIAKKFAAGLQESENGELVATASRTKQGLLDHTTLFGGRGIEGYEALLAEPDVDAVYISLPNALHREWSIRALEAGKHVLCEKPIALSAAEAEEMFTVSERTGKLLMEAFMYRAMPQTQRLLDEVKSGAIGDVKLVRSNFTFSREASPDDARYQPGAGGGSLMDVGCYCIDLIRALAGEEPTQVSGVHHRHELGGVDDYAAATLGFSNGLVASLTCGMTVVSDLTTHIAGTLGRIEIHRFWRGDEGYAIVRPGGEPESFEIELVSTEETGRSIYAVEADAFADVVEGKRSNWNPPENTIANMRVLDRIREVSLPV